MNRLLRHAAVFLLCAGLLSLSACRNAAPPTDSSQASTPVPSQEIPSQAASHPGPKPGPESQPEPESQSVPEPQMEPEPQPELEPQPVKNTRLYILMYHHLVPDGEECNDFMTTDVQLRADLQWLSDHGYTTVLPRELVRGEALPERAVLLTFDDGYRSNYELAFPLLQEFHDKAVVSPIVSFVENGQADSLTWDMCREMAGSGLVEFGSHTYDAHREDELGIKRRSGESREAYEARVFPDLEASISLLEENLGRTVYFFAYPQGKTDSWASDYIREHFAMTVTTRHGPADISGGLYDLPRINVNTTQTARSFLPS